MQIKVSKQSPNVILEIGTINQRMAASSCTFFFHTFTNLCENTFLSFKKCYVIRTHFLVKYILNYVI